MPANTKLDCTSNNINNTDCTSAVAANGDAVRKDTDDVLSGTITNRTTSTADSSRIFGTVHTIWGRTQGVRVCSYVSVCLCVYAM